MGRRDDAERIAMATEELVALGRMSSGRRWSVRSAGATDNPSYTDVFAKVPDPVGAGIVESLARPGGNMTGFINFEYSIARKWLEVLKQLVPGLTRAAVLRDPANPAS